MLGDGSSDGIAGIDIDGRVGLFVGVLCVTVGIVEGSANGTGREEVAVAVFVLSEAVFEETIVIFSRGMSQ